MRTDSWDYWHPRKENEVEPEIPKLAELLQEKGFTNVLDFGCGTGRHALHFARNGLKVHGFDSSASAVERARQRLQDQGLHADLRVHDMHKQLPYPDHSFHAVIATRVIHHTLIKNVRRIATEINRVLKNGGCVFLQVPDYGDHEWVLREASSTHRILEPGTHVPLDGVEKGVPHHHFTRKQLLELFPNFEPKEIHVGSDHYRGWCFLAEKVAD